MIVTVMWVDRSGAEHQTQFRSRIQAILFLNWVRRTHDNHM